MSFKTSIKTFVSYLIALFLTMFFLASISLSIGAKDEGTLGENLILNFLADHLYPLVIPIFELSGFLAENTEWVNTVYFLVSILIASIGYVLIVDQLAKFIFKNIKKLIPFKVQ